MAGDYRQVCSTADTTFFAVSECVVTKVIVTGNMKIVEFLLS